MMSEQQKLQKNFFRSALLFPFRRTPIKSALKANKVATDPFCRTFFRSIQISAQIIYLLFTEIFRRVAPKINRIITILGDRSEKTGKEFLECAPDPPASNFDEGSRSDLNAKAYIAMPAIEKDTS